MNSGRFWLATLLASLVVPAGFLFIAEGGALQPILLFSVLTAYLGFFIFGLPTVFGLRRYGLLSLPMVTVCGVFGGIVVFFAFSVFLSGLLESQTSFKFIQAVWGAAFGGIVSLAFCLLAGIGWRSGIEDA